MSNLFVATGDLLNPIVMTDHIEDTYYKCLKMVELFAPVNISQTLEKANEFAGKAEE